jgi:hypothetical protein
MIKPGVIMSKVRMSGRQRMVGVAGTRHHRVVQSRETTTEARSPFGRIVADIATGCSPFDTISH